MTRTTAHWLESNIAALGAGLSLLLSPACVATSQSGATEHDDVRTQVSSAYGTEALGDLRSMYFLDEYRETYRGQGYTPGYDDFWVIHAETTLDLGSQRGSYESWSDQYGRIMQFHTLTTRDGIVNIDYETGYFSSNAQATFYQSFGRNFRASDTLLAYELIKPDSQLERLDDRIYLGRLHKHVALTVPASPPLHLYIDNETGYIRRMHRSLPNGVEVVYVFENYRKHRGLLFANEYRVFIDGELLLVTRDRKVNTNLETTSLDNTFRLPPGLASEPERIQFDDMRVEAVSNKLHHVGQDDHSSFYDAGEFIIGLGGYGGLRERFEAYQQALGHEKPLRYQLATHHHSDHTAGLAEAAELGAKIVLPNAIRHKVQRDHPTIADAHIITYEKYHQLHDLQMHVVSTSHAETMTVIYVPEAKTLFQEDHYVRAFRDMPGVITRNSYTLYQAVRTLNLDIDKLLSVHVGHIESWTEFSRNARDYDHATCFHSRPLCP